MFKRGDKVKVKSKNDVVAHVVQVDEWDEVCFTKDGDEMRGQDGKHVTKKKPVVFLDSHNDHEGEPVGNTNLTDVARGWFPASECEALESEETEETKKKKPKKE